MITLPAFFGDSEKQKAFVDFIAHSVEPEKGHGSLFAKLAGEDGYRTALYDKTGFPVSLLEVIDQIYLKLEDSDAGDFALRAFSIVKPGASVTDIGWDTVKHALNRGVARGGETFVEAARKNPARFPSLAVPAFTLNQLSQAWKRGARLALKLGQQFPPDLWDPRVIALLNSAMKGGEVNAGAVIGWTFEQAGDPELAVLNYKRKLLELLEAA